MGSNVAAIARRIRTAYSLEDFLPPFSMDASPSTMAGPSRLGVLLSETSAYVQAHWRTLLLGAAVFGVLTGVMTSALGAKVSNSVRTGMSEIGIDVDRMQELQERMEAGDESALSELEAMMEEQFGGENDEAMARRMMVPGIAMMKDLLPVFGIATLINAVLMLLAYAYYALVAVEGKDPQSTFNRSTKVLLPLAGVSLWSFVRSFAWIPFLGIIPAIILGPRFIAAPLIYLTEGKGVMTSVSDSYRRTRGYWAKIIGNMIVAALLLLIASIVLGMLFGIVLMAAPVSASLIVQQIVSQALFACMTVFSIRLARTVLQHPIA